MGKNKNFKLPSSEFTKFYRAFANLYGAIISTHALDVIKIFYPEVKKSHFNEDLKARINKKTSGYKVIPAVKGIYVICRIEYDFKDLDRIFEAHAQKPCFVMGPKEKYLEFGKKNFVPNAEYYSNVYDFFKDGDEDEFAAKTCSMIFDYIFMGGSPDNFRAYVTETKLYSEFEIDFLMKEFDAIYDNSRLAENNGFTNAELHGSFDGVDNGMAFSLSDQIKEDIIKGKKSVDEIRELIQGIDMPKEIKESILEELEEFNEKLSDREA